MNYVGIVDTAFFYKIKTMVHTKTKSIDSINPWQTVHSLFGYSKNNWYSIVVAAFGITYTVYDLNHNLLAYITENEDSRFYDPVSDSPKFRGRRFKVN